MAKATELFEIWDASDDELGYEWNEFHVYVKPYLKSPERYVSHDQSGCSCNSYDLYDCGHDYKLTTKSEVIAHFNEWASFMKPLSKTRNLESLIQALQDK